MDAKTDQMSRSIEEQVADLRGQLEKLVSSGSGAARDFANRAQHDGAALARSAQSEIEGGVERASDEVREHPMLAIAIAAGVGWLIGRLAR